jgi:hypothetical protein
LNVQVAQKRAASSRQGSGAGALAGVAVAADFGASDGDFHAAIGFDLALELFEKAALYFPDLAAAEAGDMDVVAGTVAFVVVLVTVDVEQIEFIDQAVFFEQIERAVDGDAMNARIDSLSALEDRASIEMALGIVHHLDQNAALASEPDATRDEGCLKTARDSVRVDSFAAGDAM